MWPSNRVWLLLLAVVLWLVTSGLTQPSRQGLVLFTPQEAEQLRLTAAEWQLPPRTRSLSPGPRIVLQHPQAKDSSTGPVIETLSPTDFFVVFEENHTPVDMDSLQITAKKGIFSTSFTARLKPYIQGTSLQAKAVQIPAGRFLIQIEIADRQGTKTTETYRLMVGDQ